MTSTPNKKSTIKNKDVSNFFDQYDQELKKALKNKTLYRKEIKAVRQALNDDFSSVESLLEMAHQARRLLTIHKAGLGNNKKFHDDYTKTVTSSWKNTHHLPVDMELQHKLADTLYNVTPGTSDAAVLLFGNKSRGIAHHILNRLIKDGINFYPEFMDEDFKNLIITHARRDGLKRLAAYETAVNIQANKKIIAIPNGGPAPKVEAPEKKRKVYAEACRPMRERSGSGDLFFTLTCFPTEDDAKRDGIDYQEYLKLYFEMCDQPWKHIEKAHDHLISMFNKASNVRFTNDDGTDISMSLIDHDGQHFTFCNSVIAKNVPGSEIFSAPRRDSINGKIVAKGRFSPKDSGSKVIENLTMHFKNGELVRFEADKGAEHFQNFLDRDPGNRFVGELGIGTNPHMKQHVMNTLLVEKIGGSFHLALGNAYSFTDYVGTPVKVDNGNKSLDHWDITTMLIGKQGTIELDGKAIMENGKFLDPKLQVLNDGWAAIPVNERPDYWKSYTGPNVPSQKTPSVKPKAPKP